MTNIFSVDYQNSILAISISLLKKYGIKSHHTSLPELDKKLKQYKNIVLIIFDGMGINILNHYKEKTPFLHKKIVKSISSVFPPTTAAATTSIHSGLSPLEHGWIGWMQYFKKYDKVIELFRDTDFYEQEKINTNVWNDFLNYEDIYTKIIKQNPDVNFTKIFPFWAPNGVSSVSEMRKKIVSTLAQNDKNLILGYWTNPDNKIHKLGISSPEISEIMEDINQEMETLFSQIDKDTIVLITADHGIIETDSIFLNEIKGFEECFKNPPSMEVRTISFFIKEDKKEKFKTLFNQHFKNDCILYTHDEYINSGLLGSGKMHPMIHEFVGDFVAISHTNKSLCYYTKKEKAIMLKSDHAGLTKEEMLVPLIILEKK